MSKHKPTRRPARQKSNPLWLWAGAEIALIIIALAAFFFLQTGARANGYPLEISVAEASAKREAGAFILDVRQPEEWEEYHIPGSTLIPLDDLEARLSELPRDQEIVVVCRSGNRSQPGRDILLDAGFTQVTSMAGGLKEWRAAGHPTVSGP